MTADSQVQHLIRQISSQSDPAAYKRLFLLYHQRLVQFALSITHCRETAEEVVSDVFMKIWSNREGLSKVENFHLYVYVSTRHHALNALARQKRQHMYSLDDSIVEFKSLYYDPEQLMITAEMFRSLHKAVLELPPRCQLIFKLVKEDGLKYREVSELLHISQKTVEAQISIAMRKINKSVELKALLKRMNG
jgi:RNA polymerase sigma-70 factor (family 1)